MDESLKQVSERTGLSDEAAKEAVEAVLAVLKEKLPAPIASQLDNLVDGSGSSDDLGDLTKGLGGLLGGQSFADNALDGSGKSQLTYFVGKLFLLIEVLGG